MLMPHRAVRAALLPLLALLLAGFVSVGTAPSAQAADVYRYWAYFTVKDGAFVAQETGPAGATPEDGDIEGYRYAAPANFEKPNLPRADLAEVTFDAVCGDKSAETGKKRVAVLLDYGIEADAADGETPPEPEALCAVVDEKANGLQTLQSRRARRPHGEVVVRPAGLRDQRLPGQGLRGCQGIPGQPRRRSGRRVRRPRRRRGASDGSSDSDTSAASDSDSDDSNMPLLVGLAVLVVAIVAGGAGAPAPQLLELTGRTHAPPPPHHPPPGPAPGGVVAVGARARRGGQPHPEPGAAAADHRGHAGSWSAPAVATPRGRRRTRSSSGWRWLVIAIHLVFQALLLRPCPGPDGAVHAAGDRAAGGGRDQARRRGHPGGGAQRVLRRLSSWPRSSAASARPTRWAAPGSCCATCPAALYEIGIACVIALTFAPQLVTDARRVRAAASAARRQTRRGCAGSAGW